MSLVRNLANKDTNTYYIDSHNSNEDVAERSEDNVNSGQMRGKPNITQLTGKRQNGTGPNKVSFEW